MSGEGVRREERPRDAGDSRVPCGCGCVSGEGVLEVILVNLSML